LDTDAELFKVAEQSKAVVTSIERVDDSGKPQAIQVRKTIRGQSSLTLQGNSLSFTTARSGNVSLDVFDLQGNRVASLYKGALSAGTHQFSLSGMARGSYLVRAKGAGLSATKRIVIK
jgi:Tol biopolymer transport system component